MSYKTEDLKKFVQKEENLKCGDCGSVDDKPWSSWNLGVVICGKCAGAHRHIGVHISKVLSVNLDEWTEESIKSLLEKGNNYANQKYKVNTDFKLTENSSQIERIAYIESKYTGKPFEVPKENKNDLSHLATLVSAGVLKVDVIEGKGLASKDINGKSDPYVILVPGNEKGYLKKSNKNNNNTKVSVKTKYVKESLDPVWNETLMMNIPSIEEGLTLFCYDYDFIGDHDYMGKCFISLQGLKPKEVVDTWLKLDEKGIIHIRYELFPL
eukprot:TRINITY_DN12921_c0_g1_i1.p1 TRINITY_DN12921_c0_g1~~TRINITY_DN12921_c0_g1_i1.p1  ORF type:complete len:268 (+),score=79.19 TRINITY_DN12921_c0_g1_i1:23-826(+)